jgi:catechol 2,3-dioxygenase-like lactoylglutathione lyase family enzyme
MVGTTPTSDVVALSDTSGNKEVLRARKWQDADMEIRRAMPVIKTERPAEARRFYEGFLGFRVAMDEDGMLMLASTSTPSTQVIVAWFSDTAVDPELLSVDVSVEVADVDVAYALAHDKNLEIVRELRDEPWGIRRFFVRDPAGQTINVASHI